MTHIYESLQNPRVKSFLEQGWFKKPVYMISGLKIARGVSVETTESKGNGVEGCGRYSNRNPCLWGTESQVDVEDE